MRQKVSDPIKFDVVETSNKTEDGASADGIALNPESYVSMNFWGDLPYSN